MDKFRLICFLKLNFFTILNFFWPVPKTLPFLVYHKLFLLQVGPVSLRYSYEIDRPLTDPLTVDSQASTIKTSCTREVTFFLVDLPPIPAYLPSRGVFKIANVLGQKAKIVQKYLPCWSRIHNQSGLLRISFILTYEQPLKMRTNTTTATATNNLLQERLPTQN